MIIRPEALAFLIYVGGTCVVFFALLIIVLIIIDAIVEKWK